MNEFREVPAPKLGEAGTLVPSTSIYSGLMAAGVEQTVTVPSGGYYAEFNATGDVYVNYDTAATVPTGNVALGGGELNPIRRYVGETTVLHLIAENECKIAICFYAK